MKRLQWRWTAPISTANNPHQNHTICTTAEKKANQIIVVIVIRQKQHSKYEEEKKHRQRKKWNLVCVVVFIGCMICVIFIRLQWFCTILQLNEWNAFEIIRHCAMHSLLESQTATNELSTKWWWQIPRAIIIYRIALVEEFYIAVVGLIQCSYFSVCLDANIYLFEMYVVMCINLELCVHKLAREYMHWRSRIHILHRNWSHTQNTHRHTHTSKYSGKWLRAIKCSGKSYICLATEKISQTLKKSDENSSTQNKRKTHKLIVQCSYGYIALS